ncbi:MAG: adenosylcobinamide-phosphate synthase [Oleiphilaceae bacterium]|jgi:adenosylcobinamide-phosphate synthase
MVLFLVVLGALVLDFLLGEAKRYHPLVGFGSLVLTVESALNKKQREKNKLNIVTSRCMGSMAYLLLVVPIVALSWALEFYLNEYIFIQVLFSALVLYIAIGWRSLLQHAKAISIPLKSGDLNVARQAVAMIVSRDTASLNEADIARAATESVLENGADAIFSALFWFVIAGVPGVVLYRLSNTLDAMWGYKTERFLHFGWCAARVDDVLNFIPARLTALSYALLGNTRLAIQCWLVQGRSWKSPNAGPVMAAGAGALSVSLGGAAPYHGEWQTRPHLGPLSKSTEEERIADSTEEQPEEHPEKQYQASALSIEQACVLVNKTLLLWLAVILILAVFDLY